jgi:hypothetical protein
VGDVVVEEEEMFSVEAMAMSGVDGREEEDDDEERVGENREKEVDDEIVGSS